MPMHVAVARFNKRVTNPLLRHLAGHGWFVEVEHAGRRSGKTYRTPIMAFRQGPTITVALTYGRDVDWLHNLRAAGGGRMHVKGSLVTLGAPRDLSESEGLRRMPVPIRQMLPVMGCHDFVELPVLEDQPWRAAGGGR